MSERIVVVVGLAAVLVTIGRYLDTVGHHEVSFGWFAYAPLNATVGTPGRPQSAAVHLAIWGGVIVVWTLASLRLIGSVLGRRIVVVLALAGVLIALGQYLLTLGNAADRPGLQFLSSEQLARSGGALEPWAQCLIWFGLAVVWTIGAVLVLRRRVRASSRAETG